MNCSKCGISTQVLKSGVCKGCYGDPVVEFVYRDGSDLKKVKLNLSKRLEFQISNGIRDSRG